MTRLEMVEKIKDKTGVTYDEARETLEKTNWDMLDAIVELERANLGGQTAQTAQAAAPDARAYEEEAPRPAPQKRVVRRANATDVGDKVASVLRMVGAILKKGEENHVEVTRKDESVLSISLTALVLLFLVSWWIPTLLIITGLFTGYKFRLTGGLLAGRLVNSAADKASAKADEMKAKMAEPRESESAHE